MGYIANNHTLFDVILGYGVSGDSKTTKIVLASGSLKLKCLRFGVGIGTGVSCLVYRESDTLLGGLAFVLARFARHWLYIYLYYFMASTWI